MEINSPKHSESGVIKLEHKLTHREPQVLKS